MFCDACPPRSAMKGLLLLLALDLVSAGVSLVLGEPRTVASRPQLTEGFPHAPHWSPGSEMHELCFQGKWAITKKGQI